MSLRHRTNDLLLDVSVFEEDQIREVLSQVLDEDE